jgi:NADH-quinone oxidoreductase subunit A
MTALSSSAQLYSFALLCVILLGCAILPALMLIVSQVVQAKNPTPLKYSVYESGMEPYGDAKVRYDIKFYLYALLFILFDIESIFLFPWAVSLNQLGLYALIEMFLFIGILALGLAYAWRKGALRWQ